MEALPTITRMFAVLATAITIAILSPGRASATPGADSLSTPSENSHTSLGGYGNAFFHSDRNAETSTVDLERVVLFIGHSFGSISLFSELEVEDAKVSGGESGGEVSFEQAYLRFDIDPNHSVIAGLFTPRIGIMNERHLPTEFNGNERTQVETLVLPITWREIGVQFSGRMPSLATEYTIAVVNGLNSAGFEHGSGIREGRSEGRFASANNIALTGSLQSSLGSMTLQVSGYFGGSVGLNSRQADSLQLQSGLFGTPIGIGECHLRYEASGWEFKALGTFVSIPKAFELNRAYASNVPHTEYGAYAEIGYDLLVLFCPASQKQLIVFARYETLDLNATVPSNGLRDETLNQQHIVAGLTFFPIQNVVLKGDVRFMHTGDSNPSLSLNPNPAAPVYRRDNVFLSVGLGYAF